MKPSNVGELMEFLAQNYTPGEICEILDLESEALVYYLKDPIEEKAAEIIENEFENDEDFSEDA